MTEPVSLVYLANARFPTTKAHSIQVARMCESFATQGSRVELLVPRLEAEQNDPFAGNKNISIRRIWTTPWRGSRFGFLLSSAIFGVLSTLAVRKRRGILYSIDLDYFSFFLLPFLGRPYFFEIHSAKKPTLFHRWLFRRITGVIAINENVRKALETTFPSLRGKILVFPNGVELAAYNTIKPVSIEHPAVVYTGSFQDWKGLEILPSVARKLPSTHFYLVGGETFPGLNTDALSPNIHLVARQPKERMPAWQSAADLLLLTGTKKSEYSFRYTSPMKLYEYMAAARPIIAAKTAAIEQSVTGGEVFFYKPDDKEDLEKTIVQALRNPEEGRRRAKLLKERAGAFTWEKRAKAILAFIAEKYV